MTEELQIDKRIAFRLRSALHSKADLASTRAMANREALLALMAALRAEEDAIRLGGGAKAAEAQHAKGRLTVRERLNLLLDEGRSFWNWAFGRRMACMPNMAARRARVSSPGWAA